MPLNACCRVGGPSGEFWSINRIPRTPQPLSAAYARMALYVYGAASSGRYTELRFSMEVHGFVSTSVNEPVTAVGGHY